VEEAPLPKNEAERLRTLEELDVLDTALEERFERITRMVCHTLNVPIAAISLVDQDRQWFKSIQGLSVPETPRSIAFCAHSILDDKTLIVSDALLDNRFSNNPLVSDNPNIRFYAGSPLTIGDNVHVGTLCAIDDKPRNFDPNEITFLEDLAQMVCTELKTVALSKANQQLATDLKQAERAALIDPLSRLWNRAGGEQLLRREWLIAERKSIPLSVAMLDIDRFKEVNDTHGHGVGDEVIQQVGRNILSNIRPQDAVCRWGGEEFMIVLAECDAISQKPISTTAGPLTITASLGAASIVPAKSADTVQLLKMADDALYEAKRQGRDRCVVNGLTPEVRNLAQS
jgi:diguanylate cyclase (GGDEF)-like protein